VSRTKVPPIGANVLVNVANIWDRVGNPIWVSARVTDLLSTQFVYTLEGGKEGIAFYAHDGETWKYADANI